MKSVASVLLVDDSEADLFLAQHFIEKTGRYQEVVTARDGVDALQVLNSMKTPPTLILLDINMPRMDGWQFVEKLKDVRDLQSIVVVMLTSSSHDADRDRASHFQLVKDYLVKPPNTESLTKLADRFGRETN